MDLAKNAILELADKMKFTRQPGKNHSLKEENDDGEEKVSAFLKERSVDDTMEEQFPGMNG